VVASLVAATIYSVPPRLKAQPFLGLLCNTLIFAPLLGLALEDGTTPRAFTVLCTTFVGLLMQSQLLHETADAAEDQAAGALTTARLLGAYGTRAMVIAIALVFTVVGFAHAPEPLLGWMSAVALGVGAATSVFARRPGDARGLLRVVALVGGVALFLVGTVA
jgi:4-hydroxybenzoate polyprenyltransferase